MGADKDYEAGFRRNEGWKLSVRCARLKMKKI